ncbi:MAG: class I tRNA ligase family protein, partial [Actinobacteria bacterium]|nr:class I tRNA ligase family protein [Actinomycetota bacterium]
MSCDVLPAGLSMSRTPSDTGLRLVVAASGRPALLRGVNDLEGQPVGQDRDGLVLDVRHLLEVHLDAAGDRRLVTLGNGRDALEEQFLRIVARRLRPAQLGHPACGRKRAPAVDDEHARPAQRLPVTTLARQRRSVRCLHSQYLLGQMTAHAVTRRLPIELRGYLLAQERHKLVGRHLRREAGRLPVTAAALGARDERHVDRPVGRTQRDLRPTGALRAGQLAGERRDLRPLHGAQVIDDPLGIGLLGARLGKVLARQPGERQPAAVEALHALQRARQQGELRLRDALVKAAVDLVDVDAGLEAFDSTGAGKAISRFVDDLSNWYVRRSRSRFWAEAADGLDADKDAAFATLHECLVTLAALMAPFTPFLADELYENLVRCVDDGAPDSVHLLDF